MSIADKVPGVGATEPWPGYDEQSADEITSALRGADVATARQVIAYERIHQSRAVVIDAASR
jgi:hypothetical protein